MTRALVGHTGFVGSNIAFGAACAAKPFDGLYSSRNVEDAFGTRPELLVYSGMRAEKFLANRRPDLDSLSVVQAEENIARIDARTVVLISTIDVYPSTRGSDERSAIDPAELEPYGANRLELERWVEAECPRHLVVRLPALFGRGLKKNFIYDLTHPVPKTLSPALLCRLGALEPIIASSYDEDEWGFFQLRGGVTPELDAAFSRAGFDARTFTDSRSRYQFFGLAHLWDLIERSLDLGIERLNVTSEPLSAGEVAQTCLGAAFENELGKPPFDYDLRSLHADSLGGENGYLYDKQTILDEIRGFLEGQGARP